MNGIYNTCVDLISHYVFNGVVIGSYEELITKLIATCASLFVVALPFIVVFMVLKMIVNAFNSLWG